MSEFVFHPEVVKDLEEIWDYIAADNLDAADRVQKQNGKWTQTNRPCGRWYS